MIAVVIVTYNRAHLLRQCVEKVVARTTATSEVVIWDNASTDGTSDYVATIADPRVTVIRSPRNIGQNAYAEAFASTSAPFLLELDDDVIDAPDGWDRALLDAYQRLPEVGFLAASLVDDPHDWCSQAMYRERWDSYRAETVNGVELLLDGAVGGYCSITDRELHDQIGGFPTQPDKVFFAADAAFTRAVRDTGRRTAILASLQVHHAGGDFYSEQPPEKLAYLDAIIRRQQRRDRVKRVLLRIPGLAAANARRGWFHDPDRAAA
jgi:rhamnopyranosyl-N-acetylglucosaminyl-diphospho-decaprenol beta-1,3/1,4-galactofuranosyltransferase